MDKLAIEYVSIDSIKPYEGNAKEHPQEQIEQIKKSIEEFGNIDPIGVWHNEIVEGHGRYAALKELGVDNIPIIRLDDLTDEQRKAYTLIHNQLTMNTGFDVEALESELASISDIDMGEYGFDIEKELGGGTGQVEEDDFNEELPEEPISKLGDIYQLGDHRLMCGDSTNPEHVAKLMEGQKADMYLTDPPYNVALGMGGSQDEARKRHRKTDGLVIMNDSMGDSEFRNFLVKAFKCAQNHMNEGAAFYIWHADNEGYNFRGACRDIGWQVRQTLIWNKNAITLGRQDYQWKHEPCLYGWNNGTHHWYSDRKQSTVIDMDRPTKSTEHPTMKPIALFAYQIQCSTRGGTVGA